MTFSPVQKALVCSACVSGGIFAATAVPFAMYSSQPVELQLQNQQVFSSELNALSAPYLGVTGAFSVALGTGILGVTGWRLAASKSEAEKNKASELERNLLACKSALEKMQFSDTRLKAQNLETFLEPAPQPAAIPAGQAPNSNVLASVDHSTRSVLEMAMQNPVKEPIQTLSNNKVTVPVPGHAHLHPASKTSQPVKSSDHQVDLLLNQIRMLAAQVEDLQTNGPRTAAA